MGFTHPVVVKEGTDERGQTGFGTVIKTDSL